MAQGGAGPPQPDLELWRQYVRHWFPRLHENVYFVPPVYMNKVSYLQQSFADLKVSVPQAPLENPPSGSSPALHLSSAREDQTQQRILHCLQTLAEVRREPMVVVSQLQFGDYLGESCFAAAAAKFPRPDDLKRQQKHRGDFDLLLVHMHYGLIVAEIKTVGDNFASLTLTEADQDNTVMERMKRGIKQLNKDCEVLRHLVSDLKHPPRIRKIFMLPNITRDQLQRALNNHQQIRQELCECLDTQAPCDPADVCLTADEVSDPNNPSDVTEEVLERLSGWWRRAVTAPFESEHVDLVARFAGPATTVRVFSVTEPPQHFRSRGEGVLETSRRFTRDFVLLPHQLDVLNKNEPKVCLCGPPGTGKSLMLVVRARDWMCRGWHVHVVSVIHQSLAASHLIAHQLQQMDQQSSAGAGQTAVQRVHHHVYNFAEHGQVEVAVSCLALEASRAPGPLCVVVDEAFDQYFRPFTDFCTELHKSVSGLRLWAASLYSGKTPPCMTEIHVTEPLRTPPLVTREVRLAYQINQAKDVPDYTVGPTPLPSQGPAPLVLYHAGEGHSEGGPDKCEKCGHNVAAVLTELHVALAGQVGSATTTTATTTPPASSTTATIPAPLTYRDVFLLTSKKQVFHDDERDDAGNVAKPACGLVRGLRLAGVPVKVILREDATGIKDVAVMAGPDHVVAASATTVCGLERAVVVWVESQRVASKGDEMFGRLLAMSRTTSQLVRLAWPRDPTAPVPVEEVDDTASQSVILLPDLRFQTRAQPQ